MSEQSWGWDPSPALPGAGWGFAGADWEWKVCLMTVNGLAHVPEDAFLGP